MSTNLYDVLGVSRNASPEDIRKAYRRKALETHPDRLPPGASAAQKSASEDMFRMVNNAYEVLCDPQNRATYDEHGVWPPPTGGGGQGPFASSPGTGGAHSPFSDPFFQDPFSFSRGPRMDPFGAFGGFGARPGARGFTDPFVLFDSIFGNLHRALGESDPFFDAPFGRRGFGSSGQTQSPFGRPFFEGGFPPMMMMPSPFDASGMGSSRVQAFSSGGDGGRWISESWSTSSVNGATHTRCVRRDSDGNEHVVYRYPDGTERRTVNGIDQSNGNNPSQRAILAPPAPPVPSMMYPTSNSMPAPPTYSEAVGQRSYSSRHHSGHHDDYYGDRHGHRDRQRHEHSPRRDKSRERGREYEGDRDRFYRDDGRGHDGQNNGSRKFWRS